MQSHHPSKRRTNRAYKSLHKPLTYFGVERTLFYLVCVGAVGAFNIFNSILAGLGVFVGGFALNRSRENVPSGLGADFRAADLNGSPAQNSRDSSQGSS